VLVNWCLRMMRINIKIVKCLEYSCWSTRKKKIKVKSYYSAGTLNRKMTVNKTFTKDGILRVSAHKVSMAVGEIREVITYKDAEVISLIFCEHFFVNNCGCIDNTRFPSPRYTISQIVLAIQEIIPNLTTESLSSKDLLRERIYKSSLNSIYIYWLE